MAATVGSLNVDLAIGTQRFKTGLSESQAALNRAAGNMKVTTTRMSASFDGVNKSLGVMTNAMKAAGAAAVAGFTIGAVKDLVMGGLEYASSLGEVAQQLGVSSTALQQYRFIATQTGIAQDAMDAGLAKLTRSIGSAAAGGKAQAAAFGQLGVAVRGANGEIRPTEEIMRDLVAAFSAIKDPATRARLEVALFGKAGQQLDTLLAGGVEQVDNLSAAAKKLGIVLSPEQIKKADDAADTFSKVKMVLSANLAGVVADNTTAILQFANGLATAASAAGGFISRMTNLRDMGILDNPGRAAFGARNMGLDPDTEYKAAAKRLMSTTSGRQMVYWDYRNKAKALDGKAHFDEQGVDRTAIERNRLNRMAMTVAQAEFRARAQARKATDVTPTVTAPSVNLGGGGGGRRSAAGGGTGGGGARAAGEEARALEVLYERLYPEAAKERQFLSDLSLLTKLADAGGESAQRASEAISALWAESRGRSSDDTVASFPQELKIELGDLEKEIARIPVEVVKPTWDQVIDQNARMARSFVDAAQDARYSLSSLAGAIKSGDFLDILDAGLRLFEIAKGGTGSGLSGLVGSIGGLFGGSNGIVAGDQTTTDLARWFPNIPKLADGGVFYVGSRGGVDIYL